MKASSPLNFLRPYRFQLSPKGYQLVSTDESLEFFTQYPLFSGAENPTWTGVFLYACDTAEIDPAAKFSLGGMND
jgi:hypothetical protein